MNNFRRLLTFALLIAAIGFAYGESGPSGPSSVGVTSINGTDVTPSSVSTASVTATVSTLASASITNAQITNATATTQTVTGVSSLSSIIAGTETVASATIATLTVSNLVLASATYVEAIRSVGAGSQASIASGTAFVFDTKNYDTLSEYNSSTGVFTNIYAGKYAFSYQISLASSSTFAPLAYFNIGGSINQNRRIDYTAPGALQTILEGTRAFYLPANTTVSIVNGQFPNISMNSGYSMLTISRMP